MEEIDILNDKKTNCEEMDSEKQTPDDILKVLGKSNHFLLSCIILTGLSWTVLSMTGLNAAFITQTCTNCTTMISIVDEWGLRDSKSYLADLTTTGFMVGNMVGGALVAQYADKYGRKPVFLLCLAGITFSGILAAFSTNIETFFVCRLFQGVFYTGGALVGWVLGYECAPLQLRCFTNVLFGLTWVLGYCMVAPLAYISSTWRWLIVYTSFPNIILALICYLYLPESLYYLVSEGRSAEIKDWLRRADPKNFNNVRSLEPAQIVHTKITQEKPRSLISELLKYKIFIVYTSVLIYLWICDTFIYFGLSLYSTHLAGNVYVNYLLMGLVEVPAYILSPIAMNKYGRKFVLSGTHILAALSFAGLIFCSEGNTVTIALWMLGKFSISCSFMSIYVYASEIFPTNIRNLSIGFCETLSRIGGILAPYVTTLGRIWPSLPMVVLGFISLLGGLLVFIMPETLNKPLPSTIHEISTRDERDSV
ncbi:unnamed protein product [Auanema sp. JU1783]|nr:unnamed protein product [Auanema sp. JU1783]